MSLFILAKIVHILSAIFFIGVVSFRTFIMPVLRNAYNQDTYKNIDNIIGKKARNIIKINNIFLIISGFYLLSFYFESSNALIITKVFLGLVVALTFYAVPIIMKKFSHLTWFSPFFHYLFFSLMICVVVLSQLMFSFYKI